MNSPTRKWQPLRNDQRLQICLVQVDIAAQTTQHDQFTNLVLKRAKDTLKEALVLTAERRGGKPPSWEDDTGTFLFPVDGPDSFDNCCLAAIQMLQQLPLAKLPAQLPPNLDSFITIRVACDAGELTYGPDADKLQNGFVDEFKKHRSVVSADNRVTITDRFFRQLNSSLKSTFVKWKHSNEVGADIYSIAAPSATRGLADANLSSDQLNLVEEDQPTLASHRPAPRREWLVTLPNALNSRKALTVSVVIILALTICAISYFWSRSPPLGPSQYREMVQSDEWRSWRKQLHEKLSAGKVTEKVLAEAISIKLPARPENAAAALRRDQAIADVLMSYPDVPALLEQRFGIYKESFLGTGLSKPTFSTDNYGAASVHEYLIKNYWEGHPAVWMRVIDPNQHPEDMRKTVRELVDADQDRVDPKDDNQKEPLRKDIVQRAKENDATNPPVVIRFARLDAINYSHKLGKNDRQYVFASNLGEVWNTNVRQAAQQSGYTVDKGDSVYIWVFRPNDSVEVVPATWDQVLRHLPQWLSESDRN